MCVFCICRTLKKDIIGLQDHDWAQIVRDRLGVRDQISNESLVKAWQHNFKDLYPLVQALPGAYELCGALRERGIPQCIATSSSAIAVQKKKQVHDKLFAVMEHVTCGDDITKGKPDPEIFELAAKKLGIPPEHCIVFEDSPSGVQAAKRAGMKTIAVPQEGMDLSRYEEYSDLIIHSLEEFEKHASRFGIDIS